jgi:hypothetical protein
MKRRTAPSRLDSDLVIDITSGIDIIVVAGAVHIGLHDFP